MENGEWKMENSPRAAARHPIENPDEIKRNPDFHPKSGYVPDFGYPDPAARGGVLRVSKTGFSGTGFRI